ncbi:MAG: hypothetical protein QOD99_847, partial [Chthoniobacter sp.]|nr:hypothetical protein [Chthoniobacter sp.]
RFLSDRSRDNDERNVELSGLEQGECIPGVELGQVEIADDRVKGRIEILQVALSCAHYFHIRLDAGAAQFADEQICIGGVVLEQKNLKREESSVVRVH